MESHTTNNDEREKHGTSSWVQKAKNLCYKRIPIIQFCRHYSKMDLIADIIAGGTIALTMIPQSIAYASLAGLKPQYGLNSIFMGGFVYSLFGTVKEVSIGPTSLLSLLTFEYTRELNPDFVLFLTFISGAVEFLMGLLKLGFLINFISAPVTSGFTTATSIIIIVSQLKGILGVRFKSCGFLDNIFELMMHASETKLAGDFALGILCIIFLLILKNLKEINIVTNTSRKQTLKKVLWFISISRNAIIVLICICIASWFEYNNRKPPFILSGTGASGVPPFELPPFSSKMGNTTYTASQMVEELGSGVIIVPIVAVLANVAIAKAFSTGRTIDATQEMFALSLCNILGSCFGSMPTCGAFTRSAVSNASGVRSPIAGIFSGCLCLLALNFLSPYFHLIPRATLSAILICAVVFLIDWEIVVPLWKTNKKELFVLVLTLLTCLCFGVEIGLFIGVICNLSKLLYLWGEPTIKQDYLKSPSGEYVLLTPDKGLFFPAVDKLHSTIIKAQAKTKGCLPVVIDCIHFSGFDYTAAKALVNMIRQSEENNWQLIFLNIDQKFVSTCWNLGCENIIYSHNQTDLDNILSGKPRNTCKSVTLNTTRKKEEKNSYLIRNQSESHEIIALLEQTINNPITN